MTHPLHEVATSIQDKIAKGLFDSRTANILGLLGVYPWEPDADVLARGIGRAVLIDGDRRIRAREAVEMHFPDVRACPIDVAMVEHEGVDALGVLLLGRAKGAAPAIHVQGREIGLVEHDGDVFRIVVELRPDTYWYGRSGDCISVADADPEMNLVLPDIPETVLATATGLPLARLVSHPVLDRWPLTVTGWKEGALTLSGWPDQAPLLHLARR